MQQRGMALDFWVLVVLEWILLFAAAMTFMGGIRGTLVATLLLSGLAWFTHPRDFWKWEIPFLIGVMITIGILLVLARKAGKSEIISGLAGGVASLVVFGAFITPFLALFLWALIMGTGLVPKLNIKTVLWGFSPMLWRAVMGIGWIVYGNLLL